MTPDPTGLRLYDYAASANCYKVRLLLAQLRQPYEREGSARHGSVDDLLRDQRRVEGQGPRHPESYRLT